jgi:DNA-binding transcriptional ArsR family regulator/rhodanese-related sulfurtransferase
LAADTRRHREFKDRLYGQFARIGKALSSPHRLEVLELLAQGERTVESLAGEIGLSLANASQHLQALRQASLVDSRKDGLYVYYRLADPAVADVSKAVRTVAEHRLAELDRLVRDHFGDRSSAEAIGMEELLRRARSREIVVLDTRPSSEYLAGHIAGAISVPVEELQRRLRQLPKTRNTSPTAVARTASTRTMRSRSCDRRAAARSACSKGFQNGGRLVFPYRQV